MFLFRSFFKVSRRGRTEDSWYLLLHSRVGRNDHALIGGSLNWWPKTCVIPHKEWSFNKLCKGKWWQVSGWTFKVFNILIFTGFRALERFFNFIKFPSQFPTLASIKLLGQFFIWRPAKLCSQSTGLAFQRDSTLDCSFPHHIFFFLRVLNSFSVSKGGPRFWVFHFCIVPEVIMSLISYFNWNMDLVCWIPK